MATPESPDVDIILQTIAVLHQNTEDHSRYEMLGQLKLLNTIMMGEETDADMWKCVRDRRTVEFILSFMTQYITSENEQVFCCRLLGNMATHKHAVCILSAVEVYKVVMQALKVHLTSSLVQAEGFRTLGFIVQHSKQDGESIARLKYWNNITLVLSEMKNNADVCEHGCMALANIFSYDNQLQYPQLPGRTALLKELLMIHCDNAAVHEKILSIFTALAKNDDNIPRFLSDNLHFGAVSSMVKFQEQVSVMRAGAYFFEKLTMVDNEENLSKIAGCDIVLVLKSALQNKKISRDRDFLYSAISVMEYLEEYGYCPQAEAVKWVDFLFTVLDAFSGDEAISAMQDVACRGIAKVVQLRNDITIDESKYRKIEHILHVFGPYDKEIFIASCGALCEILVRNDELSQMMLGGGMHVQVLGMMKKYPHSDDVQYVGCLFLLNLHLVLPEQVRRSMSQLDPNTTFEVLYDVFCETEDHSIAVKEICLAALTLYARDKCVRRFCSEKKLYRKILSRSKVYSLISYMNQITLLLVTLLCQESSIAEDLLYNENCLTTVSSSMSRNVKYKEVVTSGLLAMSALMSGLGQNVKEEPVQGLGKAVDVLLKITTTHIGNIELMKLAIKTISSLCKLAVTATPTIQLLELLPQTLELFRLSQDNHLCQLIYLLWISLALDQQTLAAMLLEAIKFCDTPGVQIFLGMNADVNKAYNNVTPIMAAVEQGNPEIVRHILWQNVEHSQIRAALSLVMKKSEKTSPEYVTIIGYLLRAFGYKPKDGQIDWCNIPLETVEPEWLYIVLDEKHAQYRNPKTNVDRKVSVASRASHDCKLLRERFHIHISHLSQEFFEWQDADETKRGVTVSLPKHPITPPTKMILRDAHLESKTGVLEPIRLKLIDEFLGSDVPDCKREADALKEYYTVFPNNRRMSCDTQASGNQYNRIDKLDLSNNVIGSLDKIANCLPIITRLKHVTELNLNHNNLVEIPEAIGSHLSSIQFLDLSYNSLNTFPFCILNMPLKELNVSFNEIPSEAGYPGDLVCKSITYLTLKGNQLTSVPKWVEEMCPNLINLCFSQNNLKYLPDRALQLPNLVILDFAQNKITNIPDNFFNLTSELGKLYLTSNHIVSITKRLPELLPQLTHLQIASNRLILDEIKILQKLPKLKQCILSANMLTNKSPDLSCFVSEKLTDLDLSHNRDLKELVVGNAASLSLEVLNLSGNNLIEIPPDIKALNNLTTLNLSNNIKITSLPNELGNLTKLTQLKVDGLHLDIPQSIIRENRIVLFLRQKLKNCQPYYRMKLMVVGREKRGKTSLVSSLMKLPKDYRNVATNGVVKKEWRYPLGDRSQMRTLSVWDFAGQEEFYATHQCFLTDRSIYLVVFSLDKGDKEIENIKPWLHTIKARAPNSPVIIVGTHLDKSGEAGVDISLIEQQIQNLISSIATEFLPNIVEYHFVTAIKGDSPLMRRLKDAVIRVAENAEAAPADYAVGPVRHPIKIMGEKVPTCFLELEKFVGNFEVSKQNIYYPFPILKREELIAQLKQSQCDIDNEDLDNASDFLHGSGVLLHYNDTIHGLDDLYFIKPEWLSDKFSKIITLKEGNPMEKEGILKKKHMLILLKKDIKNEELIDKLIHIMERFEIALSIEDSILIPSKLPKGRPVGVMKRGKFLQRVYKLVCIPHAFWPRLISRLALFASDRGNIKHRDYWSEGVYIEFKQVNSEDLYMLVESEADNMVVITVPSSRCGNDLLGRIVHHIDTLIEEWYKGLLSMSVTGNPYVEYLVPCSECLQSSRPVGIPHMFTVQVLINSSTTADTVTCPNHPEQPVDIASLSPDVMLQDFEPKHRIFDATFTFESSLGDGALGDVFRDVYNGVPVAVKVFRDSTKDDDLQDFDRRPHYQLRQEASILKLLDHPSVVKFVGVTLRPKRCLVLELANYGDLKSVMKSNCVSRMMQQRILMQVAEGLNYLHDKNIIFRDLKPNNILIFSLSIGVFINAKICDFGISRMATSLGLKAFQGTPGNMASEITGNQTYNNKVDIFSFGILLREMLTGEKVLYDIRFQKALQDAFSAGKALLTNDIGWPDMKDVINLCLNQKSEKRPSALTLTNILGRADVLCLKARFRLFPQCHINVFTSLVYEIKLEVWVSCSNGDEHLIRVIVFHDNDHYIRNIIKLQAKAIAMVSYNSQIVVTGSTNGKVQVIDVRDCMIIKTLDLSGFNGRVLELVNTMFEFDGLDYLIAGLENGEMRVFNTKQLLTPGPDSDYKTIKTGDIPITKIVQYENDLIVATGTTLLVYSEFQKMYSFEVKFKTPSRNAITQLCICNKMLYISRHGSSSINVCEIKTNPMGNVTGFSDPADKGYIDLNAKFKSLQKVTNNSDGPTFSIRDLKDLDKMTSQDIQITHMSSDRDMAVWLGLRNGMLIEIDPKTVSTQFIAHRHRNPLRIVVTGKEQLITIAEHVVDWDGRDIDWDDRDIDANCCVWSGDISTCHSSLQEYLQARKLLTGSLLKAFTPQ